MIIILKKNKQISLDLNVDESWRKEWKGMPEFIQEDLMPFKTIYVHFRNIEDMRKFSKLMNQKILVTTQYIWYPKARIDEVKNLRWVDES